MGLGFLKKLKPSKKWLKGIVTGVKFAGKNADLLPVVGVPAKAIKVIRGAMAVVEAKGTKNKALMAALLALPILKDANVKIPDQKIRLVVELLRDPDVQEGLYNFDLEAEAAKVKAVGLTRNQEDLFAVTERRVAAQGR